MFPPLISTMNAIAITTADVTAAIAATIVQPSSSSITQMTVVFTCSVAVNSAAEGEVEANECASPA
eukprot:3780418-Pleurochrysis_carterae.AAC.2